MKTDSRNHDAKKTLSDLRDHLARHDKPIAFLFGAGTSCALRVPDPKDATTRIALIPAVVALTDICRDDVAKMGDEFKDAWDSICEHCRELKIDPNVESILSRLRMMMSAVGKTDVIYGLDARKITEMEECVRKTIARVVVPDLDLLPEDFAHRRLARWLGKTSRKSPVEIFTLNYDVLLEHGLEAERIPYFDGFVGGYRPFFHADSLRRLETAPGASWIRLWKMHGSVNWRRVEQNGRIRVIRDQFDKGGEMIYPSAQKYDESRQQPYTAFADRLSRFLEQDDAILITAGFSFGDEHINDLVFSALENRPRTHVYVLNFSEIADDCHLAKYAMQRPNMLILSRDTGVIGGRRCAWEPSDCPEFMNEVFEVYESSPPSAPGKDDAVLAGRMKIGDFDAFSRFLDLMAAG
ncbi:hypothetical protein RBSH_03604 [Rhodopirellula baltica SH28]|uniref:Uncharacterized protein n=1 Tax=Rhodopirellula baltica SH28 TaxID=993517 RepID=K5E5M6_RHOBT|nr:SIR2 family protein [Rhodopirellula baltica]EKK01086.1 hypothetical protein RBSH_03604 [Rhodopirellula baltica SH28]